jgi:hypothetical protein
MAVCSVCWSVVVETVYLDEADPRLEFVMDYAARECQMNIQHEIGIEVCPACLAAAENYIPPTRDRSNDISPVANVGRGVARRDFGLCVAPPRKK